MTATMTPATVAGSLATVAGQATWVIEIPAPAPMLNVNQRTDPRRANPTIQAWRQAAHVYAVKAKLPKGLAMVHVEARLHFCDRIRRDVGNFYPTAKAAVDGLVDYGLIADDRDEIVIGPDMRRGALVAKKAYPAGGLMVLTITDLSGEVPA